MSLATEKIKPATRRIALVRIEPRRYVVDDLASAGGGQYTMTFPYQVSGVKRNGVSLNLVTTVSSNDDYSFDAETGLLTVKLAAAPSVSNIIIVSYYIFAASEAVALEAEPSSPSGDLMDWEPILLDIPDLAQNVENILYGVFTIQNTTVNLANEAGGFVQYLTDEDSFNDAECKIWIALNDVANLNLAFLGKCRTVSVKDDQVSITVNDAFSGLDKQATMGDAADEAYFKVISGSYSTGRPVDNNKPIPYIFSELSYYTNKDYAENTISVAGDFLIDIGNEAICEDYLSVDSGATTSDNRDWILCRVSGDGLKVPSLGTVVRQTQTGNDLYIKLTGYSGIFVGQTWRWTVAAVDYYGRVEYIGNDFTYTGNDYNIVLRIVTFGSPNISTANFQAYAAPAIIIRQPGETPEWTYPFAYRDYTFTETATEAGNKLVKISLTNNFEATFGITQLDPDKHIVYYVAQPAESMTHGTAVKRILESAGVTVNTASITAANSAFNETVSFQIPFIYESGYSRYSDYLQAILKSTLGYVSLNQAGEAAYNLVRSLPAGTETIDESLILDGSYSRDFSYDDIVTAINFNNPHIGDRFKSVSTTDGPEATVALPKAKYLHAVDNTINFEHVLSNIHDIKADIMSVYGNRLARHSFKTATENLDTSIGDDFIVDPFGSDQIDVKITGISKTESDVSIEAVDFLGLT